MEFIWYFHYFCRALYLNIPLYILMISLFGLLGLIMYAYFHDCDPLLAGRISRRDQVLDNILQIVVSMLG